MVVNFAKSSVHDRRKKFLDLSQNFLHDIVMQTSAEDTYGPKVLAAWTYYWRRGRVGGREKVASRLDAGARHMGHGGYRSGV